jgi:LEA14-like dessication related protein
MFFSIDYREYFMRNILRFASLCLVFILAGCAALNPNLKDPEVKLIGLRVLPSQSILQRNIAVDLSIYNPNRQELSVRSINYSVGIETIKLLTGTTTQVPALKSLADTPVTLEVTIDVIQAMHLLQYYSNNGVGDKVNYNFSAVIDFSAWLPSMRVDKKGTLPLNLQP